MRLSMTKDEKKKLMEHLENQEEECDVMLELITGKKKKEDSHA